MKTTLFLSALWLAVASLFTQGNKAVLTGSVMADDKEMLIGATITVLKNRIVVTGARTDINGKYTIEVEPGTYDVEFTYIGFRSHKIIDVVILETRPTILDVELEVGHKFTEVIITNYNNNKASEVTYSDHIASRSEKSRPMAKMPAKGEGAMHAAPTSTPALYTPSAGEAKPLPSAPPIDRRADDIIMVDEKKKRPVVTFEPETYEEKVDLIDVEDGKISEESPKEAVDEAAPGIISQPKPRAGLLTAGEWNDLHNWNRHWTDLLADSEITSYEDMYGFFARQRYTVMLMNEQDVPLADVVVQMKNAGEIIWETRTDNTGKAELWAGIFDKKTFSSLTVEAWIHGKKHDLGLPKSAKDGFNFFKINTECYAPTNVDIVWAVDATGSMGDEIEYLKTEVLDVIGRAKSNNPKLSFRMGTAFYRDKGDEYIVKSSGLSPDINSTVEFIQKQFAGGGGDYPEAVHSALEEVVYGQKWSEHAIARICFLVLDASPHQDPAVKASLQKTIREAARLGIRIVPLTASGIQKDTEFLMKFFGLATNGTYVFLTDHSGIGGKHLEPTTDEYKVEPLNDLLVRIITEYTSIQTCEGKSNIRFENDPQQQPGQTLQAIYFPNPAVDQFTLELPFEVQSITLYDSEGKGVRKLEKPQAGPNIIRVNDLAAGFYTIRILNNGKMQSGKLMVVRS